MADGFTMARAAAPQDMDVLSVMVGWAIRKDVPYADFSEAVRLLRVGVDAERADTDRACFPEKNREAAEGGR